MSENNKQYKNFDEKIESLKDKLTPSSIWRGCEKILTSPTGRIVSAGVLFTSAVVLFQNADVILGLENLDPTSISDMEFKNLKYFIPVMLAGLGVHQVRKFFKKDDESSYEVYSKIKDKEWKEYGYPMMYKERRVAFDQLVAETIESSDGSKFEKLDYIIDIMTDLVNGVDYKDIIDDLVADSMSKEDYNEVVSYVCMFSKVGPEFFEQAYDGEITAEDKKYLMDLRRENAALEAYERVERENE